VGGLVNRLSSLEVKGEGGGTSVELRSTTGLVVDEEKGLLYLTTFHGRTPASRREEEEKAGYREERNATEYSPSASRLLPGSRLY